MHSIEIETLVMRRLGTFPQFNKARTARVNSNFIPPTTGIWIRPTVLGGINFMSGMSDGPCTREVGTLIVQCFDRENAGTMALKEYADNLAKHFAYYKIDKLELLAPSIVDVGLNNGFYQYNVSLPYRYN